MEYKLKTKRCKYKACNQKFEQETIWQKFCTTDCRDAFSKQKIKEHQERQKNKIHKPMKRKRMNPIGKIGKRNIAANAIINRMFEKKKINTCEIMFEGCTGKLFLTNAHKHKRDWYKPKAKQEKLHAFSEVIRACQCCHQTIEDDKELTENVFNQLRPK